MLEENPALTWRLEQEQSGSAGYLEVRTRTYVLPGGMRSQWDILQGGDTAAILALTDADEVVLVRQFRPGPGRVLLELPGGNVEDDEDVRAAARRELLSETGYAARSIELVGQTWLASYATHRRHAVLARGCRPAPRALAKDPEEVMETVVLSLDEFRRHLMTGDLTDTDLAFLALSRLDSLGVCP